MSLWLTKLAGELMLPPLALVLLLVGVLSTWRRRPRLARTLLCWVLALLGLLSTPLVSGLLLWSLEHDPLLAPGGPKLTGEQAIVVLGGGLTSAAEEYGGPNLRELTLVRVRYGARLQRLTGLPLAVTGGDPLGYGKAEGAAMREALEEEFHVPVRWSEEASKTTADNASMCFAQFGQAGVRRIFLVTHAWHMRRAKAIFQHAGFTVTAAPTQGTHLGQPGALDFVPTARALLESYWALHEWLGLAWYSVRYAA